MSNIKDSEILIITNYYPPEKGAASNRIFSLAKGLSKHNYKVKIVCPLPNYPHGNVFSGFKKKIFSRKDENKITVYRLWLWPSKSSNKIIRLFSMLSFSFSLTLFFIFKKSPKKIFVQYSPVLVGFTAVFWGLILRKKIILNVSDLWPLAGLEMGLLTKGAYYNILSKMELFCYRKSHLILGQSQEILTHVSKISPNTPSFLYRNFPNFSPPKVYDTHQNKTEIKIVYAGLLGVAQGIESICKSIRFSEKVSFHIYGSGLEVDQIKTLTKPFIYYHGELQREVLHQELMQYDLGLVPLKNRIYGSVPSKIFELSRLGTPLLYFAGGEGEDIINETKTGFVVPVNDSEKFQEFIDSLTVKKLTKFTKVTVQENAIKQFDFQQQFAKLIIVIERI